MSVQLYTCLRKSTHQDQNSWYFSFSLSFFENINQEHSLLPDFMSLDSFLMCWYVKIYVRLLCLCSYYYWQHVQINAKGKANENCLFNNSVSLSLVGGNSLAHKLGVMAAVKLHLNAAYDHMPTAVMAANDTFQQKSITRNRKTFITQRKRMIFC